VFNNTADPLLQDLMESFQEKLSITKNEIDIELATFSADILDILDTLDHSETHWKIEDLLVLAHYCAHMPACDFQRHCDDIVKDLDENRHELPMGVLKQLYTRMLFILSRCTRLLQFHKQAGVYGGPLFEKVQQDFRGFPSSEYGRVERQKSLNSDDFELHQVSGIDGCGNEPCFDVSRNQSGKGENLLTETVNISNSKPSSRTCIKSKIMSKYKDELNQNNCNALEQFICRICDQGIQTSQLEAHSMLCALANACADSGSSLDECLCNMADVLERMPEVGDEPDFLKILKSNLNDFSNNSSPRINDVRSNFLMASSPAGSLTPCSAFTTPRCSQLDLHWAEYSTYIDSEDTQQVNSFLYGIINAYLYNIIISYSRVDSLVANSAYRLCGKSVQ
jgi:hypothetical protein